MIEKELKKEHRARNKVTAKILKQGGKWLSNVSKWQAKRIRRTFPQVIEGPPRQTDCESVEELTRDGIIGLYSKETE